MKVRTLNESVERGDVDGVLALLGEGVTVDAIDERTGVTALMAAVDCQSESLVALLLRHGASVGGVDERKQTALHFAIAAAIDERSHHFDTCGEVLEPNLTIVRMLLEAGADPSVTDQNGASPLDWARNGNLPGAVQLLTPAAQSSVAPDGSPSVAPEAGAPSSAPRVNAGIGQTPDGDGGDGKDGQ